MKQLLRLTSQGIPLSIILDGEEDNDLLTLITKNMTKKVNYTVKFSNGDTFYTVEGRLLLKQDVMLYEVDLMSLVITSFDDNPIK